MIHARTLSSGPPATRVAPAEPPGPPLESTAELGSGSSRSRGLTLHPGAPPESMITGKDRSRMLSDSITQDMFAKLASCESVPVVTGEIDTSSVKTYERSLDSLDADKKVQYTRPPQVSTSPPLSSSESTAMESEHEDDNNVGPPRKDTKDSESNPDIQNIRHDGHDLQDEYERKDPPASTVTGRRDHSLSQSRPKRSTRISRRRVTEPAFRRSYQERGIHSMKAEILDSGGIEESESSVLKSNGHDDLYAVFMSSLGMTWMSKALHSEIVTGSAMYRNVSEDEHLFELIGGNNKEDSVSSVRNTLAETVPATSCSAKEDHPPTPFFEESKVDVSGSDSEEERHGTSTPVNSRRQSLLHVQSMRRRAFSKRRLVIGDEQNNGQQIHPIADSVASIKSAVQATNIFRKARKLVSLKKRRYRQDGFDLDLSYVTERIIAMGFPSAGIEGVYRNPRGEVVRFFNRYHKDKFLVYNLCCEREYPASTFGDPEGKNVIRFPFEDHNPCPLHVMLEFCRHVEIFLRKDPKRVVAIHCKAGKGRTGLMICALLVYGAGLSADFSMRLYAMRRTTNNKGVTIPSQQRYIRLFARYIQNPSAFEAIGRIPRRILSISLSPLPEKVASLSFYVSTPPYPDAEHFDASSEDVKGPEEAQKLLSGEYSSRHPVPDGTSQRIFDSDLLATGTLRNQGKMQLLCPPPNSWTPEKGTPYREISETHEDKLTQDIICSIDLNKRLVNNGDLDQQSVNLGEKKKKKKKDVIGSTSFWFHTGLLPRDGIVTLNKSQLDVIFKKKADEKKLRKDPNAWPSEETTLRVEFSTLDEVKLKSVLSGLRQKDEIFGRAIGLESETTSRSGSYPARDANTSPKKMMRVKFRQDWWNLDDNKSLQRRSSFSQVRFSLLVAESEEQRADSLLSLEGRYGEEDIESDEVYLVEEDVQGYSQLGESKHETMAIKHNAKAEPANVGHKTLDKPKLLMLVDDESDENSPYNAVNDGVGIKTKTEEEDSADTTNEATYEEGGQTSNNLSGLEAYLTVPLPQAEDIGALLEESQHKPLRTLGPFTEAVSEMLISSPQPVQQQSTKTQAKLDVNIWDQYKQNGNISEELADLLTDLDFSSSLPVSLTETNDQRSSVPLLTSASMQNNEKTPAQESSHLPPGGEGSDDEGEGNRQRRYRLVDAHSTGGSSSSSETESDSASGTDADAEWLLRRRAYRTPGASAKSLESKRQMTRNSSVPRFVGTTRRNTIIGGQRFPNEEALAHVFNASRSAKRKSIFLRKLITLAESKSGTNEYLLSGGIEGKPMRESMLDFERHKRGRKNMMHHSNARRSSVLKSDLSHNGQNLGAGVANLEHATVMNAFLRATERLSRRSKMVDKREISEEGPLMIADSPNVKSTQAEFLLKSPSPTKTRSSTYIRSSPRRGKTEGQNFVFEKLGPKLWLKVYRNGSCSLLSSPTGRNATPLDYVSNAEYSWAFTQLGGLRV